MSSGVVLLDPAPVGAAIVTTTYNYTGATENWTVPAGVNAIIVTLKGGQGGRGGLDSWPVQEAGGYQGVVTGTFAVTPGSVVTIAVGSGGGDGGSFAGFAAGGSAGSNPLTSYLGAVGGRAGTTGSSGGGGGSGAASVLRVAGVDIVAAGAGGNGGNGQFQAVMGRRAEATHTPRPDATSTAGRTGMNVNEVCSTNCDGGGSGAGGGGAQGGDRGLVQFGGASNAEWFGFGGYPGANATAGFAGLTTSYDFYAGNNAAGSIVISYDTGVPGAPTGVSGIPQNGAVAVSWNAPSSGGSAAITDYDVYYATNPAGPYTLFAASASTALTSMVTGLTNGTTYYFEVLATNSQGPGPLSAPSVGVVPSDVPAAPTVTAVTAFASGLYVDFTPGASDSPITGYDYRLDNGPWLNGSVASNRLTISGLNNGQTYTVEIRARNVVGNSAASAPPSSGAPRDVAMAPSDVVAVGGNASVTLSWVAPDNNGTVITDYVVQTATALGGPYTTFTDGVSASTAATVTGLTNGTTYFLRVAAVNAVGTGANSTPVSATPFTTPSVPTISPLTIGNGALTVAFTPGSNGGSAVTAYEYQLDGAGAWLSTGSLNPFTISGLTNGTPYTVRVRARNAAGNSPASAGQSGTPRTVPAAPAIDAVALGFGNVSVAFVLGDNGGSAVTNVEYSINGGANWLVRAPASTSSPLTISGLTGGSTYSVVLRAVNAAGVSAPSNASSVTALGTPGAPVINVTSGDRALTIGIVAPSNGGSPITNYEYSLDGGANWIPRVPASTATPLIIGGLTNGTEYSVQLRAVNGVGSGTASPTVLATPATTPSAPTINTSTIAGTGGALDVGFLPPASDGGSPITNYEYSTDAGVTWRLRPTGTTTSPLTITTLSSDGTTPLAALVTYPVEIRAVNAAGPGAASAVATGITTTVPDAPTISLITAHDSSALVQFTAGANGGKAITKFEYQVDGGTWTDTGSLSGEFVISGLSNSHAAYSVVVRAVNGDGNGPASAPVTVQIFTRPDAPALGAVTAGDQTLTVAFTAGGDGGSAIQSYEYSTDGGTTWRLRTTGTTASPLTISVESGSGATLTNGTIYAVQLRAVNAAGSGAASASALAAPRGEPDAPVLVSAAPGNGQLTLTFTTGSDGGSPLTATEYTLGADVWVNAGTLSSPLTITGLTNGQSYSVAVRTVNAVAPSLASNVVAATPRTTPGSPTSVFTVSGAGTVSVTWSAPISDGGSPITGYAATLHSQATGGTIIASCPSASQFNCTFTGLANGTTVYADVVAVNAAGSSSPSAPRIADTPLTTATVSIASVTAGANNLTIAITVVDTGGSPIQSYEYSINGGVNWFDAFTATSPFVIAGLTNGQSYTVQIRAVTGAGTGAPSAGVAGVPYTIPGTPSDLVATSGPAQAVLSWTAPADNGRAITDYVVQYATNAGGPFTTFADGTSPATTATVTGLTNATAYVFHVAAVNLAGTGSWSLLAAATPLSPPSAPTITNVTIGSQFLQVTFTPSASNGGSAITDYEYQVDVGGPWHTAGLSSPFTITALTNGHNYSVALRGVNAAGGGALSNRLSATPIGLPDGVTGFTATPTAGTVTLSWNAAVDNGSPITNYHITRWVALVEGAIAAQWDTTALTIQITGLTNGQTYYFTIEATNAAGTGPRSNPRTSVTVPFTPNAPTAVSAVKGNTTASISWTAPSDNGSPITGYNVYCNGSASPCTVVTGPPPVTLTALTVFGLTNGTPYTFEVTAVNANGESLRSASSNSVTPTSPTTTSVSFTPASPVYQTSFSVTATVTGSTTVNAGTVTFTRDGAGVGSVAVSNGTATLTNQLVGIGAGSHAYVASYSGAAAFDASSGSSSVSVAKASQTITFANPGNRAYSAGSFAVAPTSSSGLTVLLASSTTSVCTVSVYTVTLVTGGTCTLIASQAGDTNWNAATSVPQSFEVTNAPQSITFADPADRIWSASTFAVAPTASSGLTVTLASTTAAVCMVSGFTITMVKAGTCSLTASQAGNLNFVAAVDVAQSFDIARAPQSAFTAFSALVNLPPTATSTLSTSGGSGTGAVTFAVTSGAGFCSVSGSTLTALAEGSCVVTATKALDDRYLATTADTATITVAKATPTVDVSGLSTAIPAQTRTVTVTVTGLFAGATAPVVSPVLSGMTINASVTPLSATVTLAADGLSGTATFTVTAGRIGNLLVGATLASNAPYNATADLSPLDITVAKASPTVNVTGPATALPGQTQLVTLTVTGLTQNVAPSTVSLNLDGATAGASFSPDIQSLTLSSDGLSGTATFWVTASELGTLVIDGSLVANASYNTVSDPTPLNMVVLKNAPTVSVSGPANAIPGQSVAVTVTVSGLVAGLAPGVVTPVLSGTSAGASFAPPSATFTLASDGLSGTATFMVTAGAVGTLAVGADVAGTGSYLAASDPTPLQITVARAVPTVSVTGATNAIPGQSQTVVVTVSGLTPGLAPGLVTVQLTGTTTNAMVTPATLPVTLASDGLSGTATFTVKAGDIGTLDVGATVAQSFTYTAASDSTPLAISVAKGDSIVNVTGPTTAIPGETIQVTVTVTGLVSGVAPSNVSLNLDSLAPGSSFTPPLRALTMSSDGTSGTAVFSVTVGAEGLLTIDGTLIANAAYNVASDPTPLDVVVARSTPTVAVSGPATARPAQTVTVVVTVTGLVTGVSPGTVGVVLTGTSAGSSALPGSAPLVLAVDGHSGTAEFTVTAGSIGALDVGAVLAATSSYNTANDPTPLAVTVARGAQSITFEVTDPVLYSDGPVTLTPSASSGLGVSIASPTPSVCTVVGLQVTLVTGGTCTLVASQGGDGSYLPAPDVSRSFEVTAAPQTITFVDPADRDWSASTFTVNPTTSSPLAMTVTSSTTDVCTIDTSTVTMLIAGVCTLTASQAGDSNFAAADSVEQSFTIARAVQSLLVVVLPSATLPLTGTMELSTTGGSSAGAVTYAVAAGGANCSISGTTITGLLVGTCVVTATKAGDDRYLSITDDAEIVTIPLVDPTITITGPATALPGQPVTVTVSVTGLLAGFAPGDVTTVLSGTTVGAVAFPTSTLVVLADDGLSGTATFTVTAGTSGTVNVSASIAATAAYAAATTAAPQAITVAQATPTIAVTGPTTSRPGQAQTMTVTVTGLTNGLLPGDVTLDLAGATGSASSAPASAALTIASDGLSGIATFTVTAGAEGTLNVGATLAASYTYTAASDPSALGVTVARGAQSITFAEIADRDLSSIPFSEAITASSGLTVSLTSDTPSVCTVSGLAITTVAIGTCTLTAAQPGSVSWTAATSVQQSFEVATVPEVTLELDAEVGAQVGTNATTVHVEGAGLLPGSTYHVIVTSTPQTIGTGTVAPDGSFSQTMMLPAGLEAGSHTVTVFAIAPDGSERSAAAYFSVTPAGIIAASSETAPIPTGLGFIDLSPERALDTRQTGLKPSAGSITELTLVGKFGVPADAVAVALNVTVDQSAAAGFVTVFPCGISTPDVSSVNFGVGETTSNAVTVYLGAAGKVCIYTTAAAHLVVDVNGAYSVTSRIGLVTGFTPARLLDSRDTGNKVQANTLQQVAVVGHGGVPADATAVVLNVTVDQPATAGFLTVYPCGSGVPNASSVNFAAGETTSNAVVVAAGNGSVCVVASTDTHLVVDVTAAYTPTAGSFLMPTDVIRLLDTRIAGTPVGTGSVTEIVVAGSGNIAADATAAVLNVTVDRPSAAGYLTVYPCGISRPNASNVNFSIGQTTANSVTVSVGASGKVCVYSSASTQLIVDVDASFGVATIS